MLTDACAKFCNRKLDNLRWTVTERFLWGELRERDHLEDLGVDGRMILKCILKNWDGEAWISFIWLRRRTGCCE